MSPCCSSDWLQYRNPIGRTIFYRASVSTNILSEGIGFYDKSRSDIKSAAFSSDIRVTELDGVRGMAILFVLLWHYVGIPLSPAGIHLNPDQWIPSIKLSMILLRSGVDLFFVLSGFLITGILIDHRASRIYYRPFFARRICRIFPLYYVLFLIFAGARFAGVRGPFFDGPIPLMSYATMTQNYFMAGYGTYGAIWLGATWSLAIEEQFYLLFPFVVRHSRRSLPWLFVVGIVGAPALRIWCYHHFGNDDFAAYTWLPCRLDSLCWGAIVACTLRTSIGVNFLQRYRSALAVVFVVLLAGAVILDAALARDIGYHMSIWGHTLLAILYASFIVLVVLNAGRDITRLFRWRPLCDLGRISYGVYLTHGIILAFVFAAFSRPAVLDGVVGSSLVLAAFILTLVIASVSYRYFEKPIIKLGHRIDYDKGVLQPLS